MTSPSARLLSLDAYRGFIMLLLVSEGFGLSVLKDYPGWEWLARQVDHVPWEGCTFWDLIQPAFTFMVGMAMPFSLAKRRAEGASNAEIFRHVAWRAFLLIVLSNIFMNWGARPGTLRLQFTNVLAQIAFGYLICFFILALPFRRQIAAAVLLLAVHLSLYIAFPGPDGPWSQTGNIGAVLDFYFLGYKNPGFYSTLNALGNALTILFGAWAGLLVRTPQSHSSKLKTLSLAALAAFALGLALQPWVPMVKRLWTCSFTFFSTGWVLLMLVAFYWLIDVRQSRRWAFPFLVLGMNSLFVYSLGQIGIKGWFDRGIAPFTTRFAFLGPLGAIPQHLVVLAGLWYLCYWLYRRQIFLKI